MYNRYVPQNDGTYRRSRIPDPTIEPSSTVPVREVPQYAEKQKEPAPASQCQNCVHSLRRPVPPRQPTHTQGASIGTFLKQLLPKGFDTEDLLVVLLLLLMAGDCQDNQNSALLTLMLYLFM